MAGLNIIYIFPLSLGVSFLVECYIFYFFRVVQLYTAFSVATHNLDFKGQLIASGVFKWLVYAYVFIILTLKFSYIIAPYFLFGYIFCFSLLWFYLIYKNIFNNILFSINNIWLYIFFFLGSYSFYIYFYIANLLSFLLLLELIAVFYYFFFLTLNARLNLSIFRYKHLLLLYIIVSFFTTILFTLAIISFVFYYGTINFIELGYFTNFCLLPHTLLIVSLLWKFGAPGFHLFKLEIYQYISPVILVLFSVFSLLLNFFLFYFSIYFLNSMLTTILTPIFFFSLVIVIFLLMFSLRYTTFSQFIAYSTLSSIILILFSIIYL